METDLARGLVSFLPRLAAAAALLGLGWLAGRLLRRTVGRTIARLGRARGERAAEEGARSGAERMTAEVVGRAAFWAVFVGFAALAGEVLGLQVADRALAALMSYLPNLLAAVLVLLAGLLLANLFRNTVRTLVSRTGVSARLPGEAAWTAVMLLAGVVALDQIGIDSTLLILAVGIVLAAVVGSAALAVGLGARHEVSNVISLHYLARSYRLGQTIQIGDVEGRIVALRLNGVVVDTAQGRTFVPAREFSQRVSRLLEEA